MANFNLSHVYSNDIIEDFIYTFSGVGAYHEPSGKKPDGTTSYTLNGPVIDCFTQGCCYWFAFILKEDSRGR